MADYDLSGLSSRSFEQLVQAIALKVIGPVVSIYGDGPDGGREATFDGKTFYPSPQNSWKGYGVIQAKFLQMPAGTSKDGQWAVSQLKKELKEYDKPDTNRRIPFYYIYATNVKLTAVPKVGSKDQVHAVLEEFQDRHSLKAYDVWDYDKIRSILDNSIDIRLAYMAWITPGDVLAATMQHMPSSPIQLDAILHNFLQKEMLADEYVNLEQAGHDVRKGIPLASVFVDLHTTPQTVPSSPGNLRPHEQSAIHRLPAEQPSQGFINTILELSKERLHHQYPIDVAAAQGVEASTRRSARGRFVLIGGPGQGKTTVAQFICQIFRAALVSRLQKGKLSEEVQRALSTIQDHCREEDIVVSPTPRFPFKVVLNEFASALSDSSSKRVNSVFAYLAEQIKARTDDEVSTQAIRKWMTLYPSIIIFDGLDEVPSSSNRDQVLAAIREFWVDIGSESADVLAIATSRPQGYGEDFSRSLYQHHALVPLSKELSLHFAKRLADVRYGTEYDRKKKVLERLERAIEEESTARLMRTPLQVTIMTALVDQMGQPPQARWNLFKSYYNVIYKREVERDIPASSLLRNYEPDINAIHSRVGLVLQIDSERAGHTDAKLAKNRFVLLVEERLKEEGHEGDELCGLTSRIVEAALERLVFLVGLESGHVGFEIRSLQEFMAAESLMEGSDEDVIARLEEIAPIGNWRNVFLFASGKCFAERQHLRDHILSICSLLNERTVDELYGMALVGSDLAGELIDDGLSRHQPKYVQSFARIAIRALDIPKQRAHSQLAAIYEPQLEQVYVEELTSRLNDNRRHIRLAAWSCLTKLADAEVDWALELAEEYWPSDEELQYDLLFRLFDGRNSWINTKLGSVLPMMPAFAVPHGYAVDADSRKGMSIEQKALATALQFPRGEPTVYVNLPRSRFGLSPIGRLEVENLAWPPMVKHLQRNHASWEFYKAAARFLENPSALTLSRELRVVGPLFGREVDPEAIGELTSIPWPLMACLKICQTPSDVIEMAELAEANRLGDMEDWLISERRWLAEGISREDLTSMSERRRPFDAGMRKIGFPVELTMWPMVLNSEDSLLVNDLIGVHGDVEYSQGRAFIATLIRSICFQACFEPNAVGRWTPQHVTMDNLEQVYADLDVGEHIPLPIVINVLAGPSERIGQFLRFLEERKIGAYWYQYGIQLDEGGLVRLERAASELDDKKALLSIFGELAENGIWPRALPSLPKVEECEVLSQRMAAAIVALVRDGLNERNVDKYIKVMEELSAESEMIYFRVWNAIRSNRMYGPATEKLLVGLENGLPVHRFGIGEQFVGLVEESLTSRVSGLAEASGFHRYKFSEGVVALLQYDEEAE